ncbi:helix-turn-helix domain-containing protein [Ideonella margarita]|uniref:Helix-turn-helix domain-containing protein n=1 Tax=Ideonella margarita TaxID=2984191 RepID=A0ABU9CAF1_9BURK
MDYPVQFSSQLQLQLKSLRKSRQMTQAELARRLGVVQSRVADIERNPGAVSVEQLLQILAMLGAQMVVRETAAVPSVTKVTIDVDVHAQAKSTTAVELATGNNSALPTAAAPPYCPPDSEPRGQW